MDRTDVTPDPDDLLETALTDPESLDAARTARLVAQLEQDDADVRRAASWAIRFVAAERPSIVDTCAGRFRRALRDPEARPVVLRTLAVLAEHNREAVTEIVDGAVEAEAIDEVVGRRVVGGYRPSEPESGGSVITDEGEEATPPTETAVDVERREPSDAAPDEGPPEPSGHPSAKPPAKPPQLDRTLPEYDPVPAEERRGGSDVDTTRFAEGGREFTAARRAAASARSVDETAFRDAVERWRRIDGHDAVARVVDHGTRPAPWLVSERGAPGSLADRDAPVPPAEARWILSRIAAALGYAHAAGVLHGGVWPGVVTLVNAVEDPDAWAYPRVGGWGLRAAVGPTAELFELPDRYVAPEHVAPDRFGGVDAATDIYGLGVIGHELLTGSAPVREDGTVRPTRTVAEGVPEGLSTVLAKALKPAKMARYASAAAFERDLAAEGDGA